MRKLLLPSSLVLALWLLVACREPLEATAWQPLRLDLPAAAPTVGACGRQNEVPLRPRGSTGASSPLALATWGERPVALVADEDEAALHVVDTRTMEWLSTTELPCAPGHLRVLADGRVAIALRYANRVVIAEPASRPEAGLEPRCSAAVVREPIALSEHGDELLVVGGAAAELVRLDRDLAVQGRIALPREPRNLLVRGDTAWVVSMVEGTLARVDLPSEEVTTATLHQEVVPPFTGDLVDAASSQGFALALNEDGTRLFAPLVGSLPPDPERDRLQRYYGSTDKTFNPFVATVDPDTGAQLAVGRESPSAWRRPCMLPRAAATLGERLFVACLDESTVLELDARFLDPMVAVYRQIDVAAGPTALAVDGTEILVWSLHGHALSRFEAPPLAVDAPAPAIEELTLPRRTDTAWPEARRRGRELFVARRDTRLSRTGVACASCHPDGRDDGLRWGTETTTRSLAGMLAGTAPYGWKGSAATLHERVQSTVLRLKGKGFRARDQADLDALVGYLESLPAPPPPLPQSSATKARIARGEHLFEDELACAGCHPGGGTRGGTLPMGDEGSFDTPSLAHIGLTAPYFHDNRYEDLDALLSDPAEPMDQTASLTDDQRADLVAFLESLPHGVVDAPPVISEAWSVVSSAPADRPVAMASGWGTSALEERTDTLRDPGRHLTSLPERVDFATIAELSVPEVKGDGVVWLSLRNVEGLVLGSSNAVNHYPGGKERPEEAVRFLAAANGADAIEVMECTVAESPAYSWYEGAAWAVVCPDEGARAGTRLGAYGPAARGRWAGHDVLFVAGPDTYFLHQAGAIDDLGNEDRGWMDIHALRTEPGAYAELVRIGADDHFWDRAVFDTDEEPTIVSVQWPEDAAEPTVLVASLTNTAFTF